MIELVVNVNIPDELELRIEKISNLGLGIAKYNGYVIFVPNSCPEDIVKVKIKKKNKNYANAEIINIKKTSPYRVEPFCKLSKVCGSCQLQFIDYKAQLVYKKEMVSDAVRTIYGSDIEVRDVIPSPIEKEYRHKIQYPIGQTKNSKRIIAGYYKASSHELVNIKHCPIQPEYCDKIIEFIRETAKTLNIDGYDEKSGTGMLRHIVIRSSFANKKNLVVIVVNENRVSKSIRLLAYKIFDELENISGVCVNFNNKKTNLILGKHTELLYGNDFINETLCEKNFKVGAKTFFQVNPACADKIFRYVKEYLCKNTNNPVILDAYAGITAFGISLSDIASKVISIEEVKESVQLAKEVAKNCGIKNIEFYCDNADKFFLREMLSDKKYHVTILDPPRKGCSQTSLDAVLKLTKDKIIYVSCNPATLARDLKYLSEQGAKVEYIQPFDMFPHTYHIENVAIVDVKST